MIEGKPDPFQYLILHRKKIINVLNQSSTLKSAWNTLTKSLPEIETIIKFNTFKGYARILKVMDGELAELTLENKRLTEELGKVRQKKKAVEKELGKVRQTRLNGISNKKNEGVQLKYSEGITLDEKASNCDQKTGILPNPEKDNVPKRIDGWGVQLRGEYYRIFKKIKGKVKWIHIGRSWNTEIAKEKIRCFTG